MDHVSTRHRKSERQFSIRALKWSIATNEYIYRKHKKKPSECRCKLAHECALAIPGDSKTTFCKTIKFSLAKCNYLEVVSGEGSDQIDKFDRRNLVSCYIAKAVLSRKHRIHSSKNNAMSLCHFLMFFSIPPANRCCHWNLFFLEMRQYNFISFTNALRRHFQKA